jgi:hypothetical protein
MSDEKRLQKHETVDLAKELMKLAVQTEYGAQFTDLLPEKCFQAAESFKALEKRVLREEEEGDLPPVVIKDPPGTYDEKGMRRK